jgi:hypothetical protein
MSASQPGEKKSQLTGTVLLCIDDQETTRDALPVCGNNQTTA